MSYQPWIKNCNDFCPKTLNSNLNVQDNYTEILRTTLPSPACIEVAQKFLLLRS